MSTSLVNKERFNPSRLSNLAVWLDAQATNTITTSGGATLVSKWADRSSNSNSFSILSPPLANYDYFTVTSGSATTNVSGGRKYVRFTTSATIVVGSLGFSCEYFAVGGGGAGGPAFGNGGGGGAGGLQTNNATVFSLPSQYLAIPNLTANTTYSINLGAGGVGYTTLAHGNNGGATIFSTGATVIVTASGGGGGGGGYNDGRNGGCGGGAGGNYQGSDNPGTGSQGYNGGFLGGGNNSGAGGGGGIGAIGSPGYGAYGNGGNGGAGILYNASAYGGGGGGATYFGPYGSIGGSGGSAGGVIVGGSGAIARQGTGVTICGENAVPNTGSGGGGAGGGATPGPGGSGSTGVFILSYPFISFIPPTISATTAGQPSVFFPLGTQMVSTLNSGLGSPTIPGCQLWLDAADTTTYVGPTNALTGWRDKSGQGNNPTLFNSGLPGPSVSTNPNNNLPGLTFPIRTVNEVTKVTNGNPFLVPNLLAGTNYSMVGVIQYAVPILANRMIAAGQWKFTYGSGLHFTYRGINATLSGTGSYTVVPTPETSTPLSPHIYAISISSSTTSVNATTIAGTDGSDTVYTTTTGPNTDSTAAAPFAIGSIFENSESYYPLTGYLHELMVFNRTLSISQLQTIEGYFATKWGLRANLPPTHPYFSVPYTAPFTLNPSTPLSKSFIALYQCPTSASAINLGIGSNVAGGAFGICQSNNTLYAPYQYAIGDLSYSVTNYTGMNYAFASFDTSTNILTGIPGLNDVSMQAVAYQNRACNTPFYLGSSSALYTSSGFHLCEFIATSNALSSTDRQNVEGYLAWKWGLSAQLPSGHPYKNFEPSGEQWISTVTPPNISGLVSWMDATFPGQLPTIVDRVGGSFSYNTAAPTLSIIRDIPYFNIPATISKNISCPTIGSALVVFSPQSNGTILGWGGSSPTLTLTNLTTPTYGTTTYTLTSAHSQIMFIGWGDGNYYSSLNGGALTVATNSLVGATTLTIGQQAGEVVVYNDFLEQPSRQILEGYLARKWNITGNLPTTHPYYSTAPTLDTIHDTGSLSIPTLFPSLTMWLDAADSSTVVVTGTSVTNWNDKSPILDVFSGTYPPIYSYTSGPSIPAVYFSGINSLRGTVNAAIASGVGSCFMVASLQNSAAQILMGGYVTGAATAGNTFGFVNTGLTYISPFQGSDRANQHVFTLGFQPPISVLFAQISASVAGGIGAGSVNFGTPTNQPYTVMGTSYSWNPSLPSSSPWVLGYTGASSPAGIQNFYLHEFLCFSEYFGDTQRQMVEGYIAWKWGIQSQLPAGHPYKNARPQSPQS